MDKTAKIYIAGHSGLVGSAILRNLQARGYANFVLRTEYVFLAAAKVGGIHANNTYPADFIGEHVRREVAHRMSHGTV